jgi:hypothetical protein
VYAAFLCSLRLEWFLHLPRPKKGCEQNAEKRMDVHRGLAHLRLGAFLMMVMVMVEDYWVR